MMRSLAFVAVLAPQLIPSTVAQAPRGSAGAPAFPARVAVVAFQQAVAQTNEGQRDFGDLQKKYAPKQAELKSLNDEIDTLTKQLQAPDTSLTDVERGNLARSIDEKKKQLDREAEDARNDFQKEMQALYNSLASKVYAVMQSYAGRQGYTLILDASQQQSPVLFADNVSNITKQVIDAYNSNSGVTELGDRPAAPDALPAEAAKIAIIAFQQAVAQTNEGQRAIADLQKKYEPKRAQLKTMSDEIESLTRQLNNTGAQMNDAERARVAGALDEKKKQMGRDSQEAQSDFQSDMQQTINGIAAKVYNVMQSYAQQQGLTIIIDTSQQQSPVLFAGNGSDITPAVIAAYNAKSGVTGSQATAAAQMPAAQPSEGPPGSTTSQTEESPAAQSPDYDSQLANAVALVKAGSLVEAETAAAALVKSDPSRWEGYGLEGRIDDIENKPNAAKAAYQHALNVAPADVRPELQKDLRNLEMGAKK